MWGIPRWPLALGLAGLLPFVAAALVSQIGNTVMMGDSYPIIAPADGLDLLASYGVVILSFMSGVLWGFATRSTQPIWYVLSVIPALYCFFYAGAGVFTGGLLEDALFNLMIGFIGLLALDGVFACKKLTPDWWMKLRALLTTIVLACLAIGAFA
jgi:hypothetical protein